MLQGLCENYLAIELAQSLIILVGIWSGSLQVPLQVRVSLAVLGCHGW